MKEFPGTQGLFGEGGINEDNMYYVLECLEREMEEEENDWELIPTIGILWYIITLIPLVVILLYKLISGIIFWIRNRNAITPENHQTLRIKPDHEQVPNLPGYVDSESEVYGDYNAW